MSFVKLRFFGKFKFTLAKQRDKTCKTVIQEKKIAIAVFIEFQGLIIKEYSNLEKASWEIQVLVIL